MVDALGIKIPEDQIADFCRRWKIAEFALFGSVLRDDFGPESDIDVLVRFRRDAHWGLFDLVHMEEELGVIFGRKVDLIDRLSIEESKNWIRRRNILSTARTVYVSG